MYLLKRHPMTFFKYAFYAVGNIFSAFVVLIFVFYANTFLNDFLLPTSWMTTYGEQMMLRVLIALTQAGILMCIVYVGNFFIASALFPGHKRVALLVTALSFIVISVVIMISACEIYWQRL